MELLSEQRRIIEDQRKIIEEQQRIISQHCALKLAGVGPADGGRSPSSSTASCSVRSLPTTVSSSTKSELLSRAMLDLTVELDRTVELDSDMQKEQACPPIIDPNDAIEQALNQQCKGGKGKGCVSGQRPSSPIQKASRQTDGRAAAPERDCEQNWRESLQKVIDNVDAALNGASAMDRSIARDVLPAEPPRSRQEAYQAAAQLGNVSREVIHPHMAGAAQSSAVPPVSLGAPPPSGAERLPSPPGSPGTLARSLGREMFKFEIDSWVLCANISHDGKWLCAASEDKMARVYNLESCHSKSLHRCFDHGDWVWTAEFSRDSQTLCTSSSDGCARVFMVETGQERNRLRHNGVVRSASFSPVGEFLCTASNDRTARVFNFSEGSDALEVTRFEHGGWVLTAGWNPTGERLCTAADDMTARIFDVCTGDQVQNILHSDWVTSVKFHPDGKRLCTGCDDHVVRVYDADSRRILQSFQHSASVCSASFSPDGAWLCTACSDANAYIHDMSTGKMLLRFPHGGRVCSANFSPDGRRLCTGSEDGCSRVFGYAMQSILTLVAMAAR